ncbi:hypothetical protein [Saccharopolyspora taberi]|uniref:Uncharacterized protein n=1 Tax=Saccharopolyspora taberi TaxID=60895 RepID=A0ABN3VDD3_9PSEU
MRPRRPLRRLAVCATVSAAVAGLGLPAALAQESTLPTTPRPSPENPGQPPESVPANHPGPIVADAGTGIGLIRILPKTVPTDSVVEDPEFEEKLPKQAIAEMGMGLATAQANSDAYLGHERAIADSDPVGFSFQGTTPRTPLGLSQTASPDHDAPTAGGLHPPASPLDGVVKLGAMNGSAHARWDDVLGPCVQPISDAKTSLGGLSVLNALPGVDGALLDASNSLEAHSNVELVDVAGQQGKAVRATSSMRLGDVRLFSGTPQELRVEVVSQPKLTATSTGDPATSTVDYQAPVLRVSRGDEVLGVLDAAKPQLDVPFSQDQLDLGVLRMSVGKLRQDVAGAEVRAAARMFDLHVLPADKIGIQTSLAQISFGEQIARAGAPAGGVVCRAAAPPAPAAVAEGPKAPPLAVTDGAYSAIPLFWTGTGLLLLGSILVAAVPRRRS